MNGLSECKTSGYKIYRVALQRNSSDKEWKSEMDIITFECQKNTTEINIESQTIIQSKMTSKCIQVKN